MADFEWPDGKKTAIVFNVAFEAWSEEGGSAIGPMGNPLPANVRDTNAVSWGRYGARTGIWNLLDVLDRHQVRATVFVSACLAAREPAAVRAIAGAGHDICCHGYAQDMIPALYPEDQERELIKRCRGTLGDLLGAPPTGWISPRGTPSKVTSTLLAAEGFTWHGDAYDSDFPYVERVGGGEILAIPLTTEVNDLSVCIRYGNPPRVMLETMRDGVSARLDQRVPGPRGHLDVLGHTHVSGRPLWGWFYGQMIDAAKTEREAWVTTKGELADWAIRTRSGVGPDPRAR